jgi:hypothetical protein
MPIQPRAYTGETATIYRLPAKWNAGATALLLPVLLVIVLLACLSILSHYQRTGSIAPSDFIFPVVFLGIGSVALRRVQRSIATTYLAISRSGIEYHSPYLVIKTTWDNVATLIDDHLAPMLWLSHAAATHISPVLGRPLATGRCIPLSQFEYSSYSAIGRDLRHYAPHLFAKPA